MTENKRFTIKRKDLKYAKILENGKDLTGYFFIAQAEFICDKWNELSEENEWLKSEIQKLYNFVKIDVDHNIEVYPKSLMEHILEILKIIGDCE